jgi:transcriptional/translational regulatory protein YebC/TACO1
LQQAYNDSGGFQKANMEAAINRGQGKSASGAALEPVVLEAIVPPQVSMIIEAESDNLKRTLGDLKHVIKKAGGIAGPTSYLFEKKGRIFFEENEKLGVDDVLDEAIEAGAEDVKADEDNRIIVWTEPSNTNSAAQALQEKLGLKVASCDLVYVANEDTKVSLDATEHEEALERLKDCLDKLRDTVNIQGIYANVAQGNLDDASWEEIQDRLDN